MQTNPRTVMTFAFDPHGRIAHIDDVENGAACQCTCPHCHSPLIAKNGGHERAHHFAHDNFSESSGCAETALHLAAKQIIADYKQVTVPPSVESSEFGTIATLEQVWLEHRLENPANSDWIVADCYATTEGKPFVIEIAVNHRVDQDKAAKLKALNIQAMEIELSDWIHQHWTWNELEEAVLVDPTRRSWIHVPAEEKPSTASEPLLTRESWTFSLNGRWIWVKKMPFGNLKVYHKPDKHLQSIVEPICRGKGYWNGKPYYNWIIFDQFKAELLAQLSSKAALI